MPALPLLSNPMQVTRMSMAELSEKSGASDATVMRVCKKVCDTGFYQFKIQLAMDLAENPSAASSSQTDEVPNDIVSFIDLMAANVAQLSKDLSMEQISESIDLILGAGTVYAFGWGNTGAIADDLAHRLLRYGINTFTSHNLEYMMRSIVLAPEGSVLIAFSRSGESIYLVECCKLARANGVKVILVTADESSSAAFLADVILKVNPVNGPIDCLGGSSHIYEFALNDILLYFLKDKAPAYTVGTTSEAILGQFKN